MKTHRWQRTAVAGLAVLALFGAACGDDDDTDDTASSGETSAEATEGSESEGSETEGSETEASEDEGSETSAGEATGDGPVGEACGAVPTSGEGSFEGMADDPAATAASNNPELSTLVSAVTAADLVDTLNGEGPFTIFAPVNSAFEAIPAADLDAVLADTELLTSILTLHVVAGEQMDAGMLAEVDEVETVNGASISIEADESDITVNGQAKVVCANIPTANATVHLIDTVLMPEG